MRAKENPFRSARVERFRYRLNANEWADLESRWVRQDRRGAIVGPHGSGKTTLLEDFRDRVATRGETVRLARLHDRNHRSALRSILRCAPAWPAETVLFLDGGEWVDRWNGFRFHRATRRLRGIVVSAHREGRLPLLHRTRPQFEILTELVSDLLERPLDEREINLLRERYLEHRGNIRDVVRRCYAGF